jgi:hypothetical protein
MSAVVTSHVRFRPDLVCRTRLLALRLQIGCTEDTAPAVVRRVDGMAQLVQRVSDILRIRRAVTDLLLPGACRTTHVNTPRSIAA